MVAHLPELHHDVEERGGGGASRERAVLEDLLKGEFVLQPLVEQLLSQSELTLQVDLVSGIRIKAVKFRYKVSTHLYFSGHFMLDILLYPPEHERLEDEMQPGELILI